MYPLNIVLLRQQAVEWAVQSAHEGEASESVIARANAYVQFIIEPLSPDLARALIERQSAVIH